ncbi:MAG: hypothetical protein ACLRVN_02565 [Butyricicoccus sp.]
MSTCSSRRVSLAADWRATAKEQSLRMLTFPQTFRGEDQNTEIVCASLGNDAGLVGAAMLVE